MVETTQNVFDNLLSLIAQQQHAFMNLHKCHRMSTESCPIIPMMSLPIKISHEESMSNIGALLFCISSMELCTLLVRSL